MIRILFLFLLCSAVAPAQTVELFGLRRGMTHPQLWEAMRRSDRQLRYFLSTDSGRVMDKYVLAGVSGTLADTLNNNLCRVTFDKGKLGWIETDYHFEYSEGSSFDTLRAILKRAWDLCRAAAPKGAGTKTLRSFSDDQFLALTDETTVGAWTVGADQIWVALTPYSGGSYHVGITLYKPTRGR